MASLITDSNANENNAVARIGNVIVAAQTQAGSDYVKKVTHPPTVLPSGYSGRPDASQPNFVPLETKAEFNVPLTALIPASATTVNPMTFDKILFVQTGGGFNHTYVFYYYAGGWVQMANQAAVAGTFPAISGNVVAVPNVGYNFNNFKADVDVFRTGYKSTTFYLNATDFSNQGTRTTAKFKPNIKRTRFADLLSTMNESDQKKAIKVLNTCLLNKTPVDRFEMLSLKDSSYDFEVQIWDHNAPNATTQLLGFTSSTFQISNVLPNTPADVLVSSPKATTSMARDGDFVVQQPVDTVVLWNAASDASDSFTQVSPTGCVLSFIRCASTVGTTLVPLWGANNNTFPTAVGTNSDTPWQNFDWSYTMFDGLSISAAAVTTPYITVKGFTGWECSPSPFGSLQPFQKMLPLPDPEALQMTAGIFHARPDSLPASANDWGTLGKVVTAALPAVANWLTGLFGKAGAKKANTAAQKAVRGDEKRVAKLEKKVLTQEKRIQQGEQALMRRFKNNNAATASATQPKTMVRKTVQQPKKNKPSPLVMQARLSRRNRN